MKLSQYQLDSYMASAISEAHKSLNKNEVPIGAVIISNNEIIAAAHNEMESRSDPTAHAECLAIREASTKLKNWRLSECVLCVTLEPCAMCIGAIKLARIPILVFGAHEPRMGAVGSLYDLSTQEVEAGALRVISGVRADECRTLLQDFFAKRRGEGS